MPVFKPETLAAIALALEMATADLAFVEPKLRDAIEAAIESNDATANLVDIFGQRYFVDFEMQTAIGSARVRSCWIILASEDFPRLTSCYVIE